MRQITYISTGRRGMAPAEVQAILAVSRRNNARDGITGLLLHDGRRFLQVLEGDERIVLTAMARIERDDRHIAVVVLKDRTVDAREFGGWAMAEQRVDPDGRDAEALAAKVDALVADVTDRNVQAQFAQFARRARAAA